MANVKRYIKKLAPALLALLVGVAGGVGVANITIKKTETGEIETKINVEYRMELADKNVPTIIETEDGEIEVVDVPTVEEVFSGQVNNCENEDGECGLGKFIYAPTETPDLFAEFTYDRCWDTDDFAGGQCYDLGDLFWQNYAGRRLSTCGTGAAKGTWNCAEQNAGDDFILIEDPKEITKGDWVVFSSGVYGHIGMALGYYNEGYVALLGQNQGGKPCEGGGSSTNVINISLKTFIGAFRPKAYIEPEPEPEPEPTVPDSSVVK